MFSKLFNKKNTCVTFIVLLTLFINVHSIFAQDVQYKKNAIYITIPSSEAYLKKPAAEGGVKTQTSNLVDTVRFTGDARYDFLTGPSVPIGVIKVDDPPGIGDVGIPTPAPSGTISGWDIDAIYFYYDHTKDRMYVGFDFGGVAGPSIICGDADGNGDPHATSTWLSNLGGRDNANLSGTESVVLLMDTDEDNEAEVAIGVNDSTSISDFGIYNWEGFEFLLPYYHKFWKDTVANVHVTYHNAPNYPIKDLEFIIYNFSKLLNFMPGQSFQFGILAFAGSLDDDGIGEEFVPDVTSISYDYGDAPDDPTDTTDYPTLLESNGARHTKIDLLYMGSLVDGDRDGQPTANADGDDNDGTDDEDGVNQNQLRLTLGEIPRIDVRIVNQTGKTAYVSGWIDYNGDGICQADSERAISNIGNSGTITLKFPEVHINSKNMTYARFRISTDEASVMFPTGWAPDGEVEDYQVEIVKYYDFGDAPDSPYPTLAANEGARHLQIANQNKVWIGTNVDHEPDGLPVSGATGDDITGIDDEDAFTSNLIEFIEGSRPSRSIPVTNNSGSVAYLYGWIDYNGNGIWELNERAKAIVPAGAVSATLYFPQIPIGSPTTTYARFRISTDSTYIRQATGEALDGEVEDYHVRIEKYDFGDAPDDPYPTLLANDGARHRIKAGFFLGSSIDNEGDGQQSLNADGDGADEDGIVFSSLPLIAGGNANITVTASQAGRLDAWIDFNNDGDWRDTGERIFTARSLSAGSNNLSFTIPLDAEAASLTYARFRFSSVGNLPFDGPANDGEVEDYKVEIVKLDYGDAPDTPYPTLLVNSGARHKVVDEYSLKIGNLIDHEPDGQPSTGAIGDGADEDGIGSNPIELIEGTTPIIPLTVFNNSGQTAILYGWIDFDGDGKWQSNERDSILVFSNPGLQSVNITFSNHVVAGSPRTTYARFRISTNPDSIREPTGLAPDGEVEDYHVNIVKVYDFGDAPDGPYPTRLTSNGARHKFIPDMNQLYLGALIDSERVAAPDPNALGDDNSDDDDEDGVELPAQLIEGRNPIIPVTVHNETGETATLVGWIDYNGNGTWEAEEKAEAIVKKSTKVKLKFPAVPSDAYVMTNGITFARFRVSTDASKVDIPTGEAPDGEVEDYQVKIAYTAKIDIEKFTNGFDADMPTGPQVPVGDSIQWTYMVTNSGNVALTEVLVKDNKDVKVTYQSGDINNNQILDVDETWYHTATGIAQLDQYANLGIVTAKDPDGNTITDTDPSHYFGYNARIKIEKSTNGDDADNPTGPLVPVGSPITWTYKVINAGDMKLSDINVTDSKGVTVAYINGDTNGDSILDVNETWNYSATGTAIPGQYTNIGTVAANDPNNNIISDIDSSNYFGVIAEIDIEKWTNEEDADTPIGPEVPVGGSIVWKYIIKNTGNVALTDVSLNDDKLGNIPLPFTGLAPAEEKIIYKNGFAIAGQYINVGTATAKGPINIEVTDSDTSHYFGVEYDFGDAPDDSTNPDDYPTLLVSNGAQHRIKSEFHLGKGIDHDGNGQPDPDAEGDDKNGIDDEDGVEFWSLPLIVCQPETVTVTASQAGRLDAWIDFNNDGDWADAYEQIFNSEPLAAGENILSFTVPCDAKPASVTFARFRFSSKGGLSFFGLAEDGEVEDYKVQIDGFDFGDAPDDPQNPNDYPTLYAESNGAYHKIKPGIFLGDYIDAEFDGLPDPDAMGDDNKGIDDEDGVEFSEMPLRVCRNTVVTVTASQAGKLDAWIDFNDDGDWSDTGEQIFSSQPLAAGENRITFTVPNNATPTAQTFARFRYSLKGGLTFSGVADDGEVEDYEVSIIAIDFGDAPDDSTNSGDYPTYEASNGARHLIKQGFSLGNSIDADADGQPDPNAEGDDNNGIDDEDGVVFSRMPFTACYTEKIVVTASQPGKLDAWIDFNDDDDWSDAGEQIFKSQRLAAGANTLTFTVPCDAKPTSQTFARFRFSSEGGLSYDELAEDGEVEDYKIEIKALDFGDAPDDSTNAEDYPTYETSTGARHLIKPGFCLGSSVDAEADGQPDSDAKGDDKNDIDDEDGVIFKNMPLISCHEDTIIVTASQAGMLDAWIDFNNDGDWADAGEQIFKSQLLTASDNELYFTVPCNAQPTSQTYARFRFSSSGGLSYAGLADDGEVEDYKVQIIALDFGDAPENPNIPGDYPTLRANNGARHKIKPGFFLGNSIDNEADGQPDANAEGDDNNGIDDEDGVVFKTMPLIVCRPANITVTASESGMLDAWIDLNGDGDWQDTGEQIFASQQLIPGDNHLLFKIPNGTSPTPYTFARFRFSSKGGLSYDGLAEDGEVEDYQVQIGGFDYGDAPDDSTNDNDYATFRVENGACHEIKPGFYLGKRVDAESDGQPNADATGDDLNGIPDDEDGIEFLTMPLIAGRHDTMLVTASKSGKLDAWIDFNNDGDWADAGEQIFISQSLIAGTDSLTFKVPCDATPTAKTFARFRFSSIGGLSFAGDAEDGEVEDYKVEIIRVDFGDAPDDITNPDDYPTLLGSGGAFHKIKAGFFLGDSVDNEADGQPDLNAKGDDNNGIDDEDGVVFKRMPLTACHAETIIVTASQPGKLDAWIDFNCDGDWKDSNEQIFSSQTTALGSNLFTFMVPGEAKPTSQTYARFRFSLKGGLSSSGFAEDGEVEDYQVEIEGIDYGDAPDPFEDPPGSYYTRKANKGARHKIDSRLYIGEKVDANADGLPNIEANGDDTDPAGDDEDGLRDKNLKPTDILKLVVCDSPIVVPIKVHNSTGKRAHLFGWIDLNGKVGWTDDEKSTTIVDTFCDTIVYLIFERKVPSWLDTTYARFRISTDQDSVDRTWGCAPDGEVEDYLVVITRPPAVNLTSFEGIEEKGQVSLNWATENEPFNEQFTIYRSYNDSTDFVKINPEMIPTQGDAFRGAEYQFIDQPKEIGTYFYKLQCVSPDGYTTFHGPIMVKLVTTVVLEKQALIPKEYSLSQNYPNPFNPETHIQFALPKEGQVTIEVYDLLGRLVRTIVEEYKPAGNYHVIWDARNSDGNVVSNGIYLVQMRSGSFVAIKKMTLIK